MYWGLSFQSIPLQRQAGISITGLHRACRLFFETSTIHIKRQTSQFINHNEVAIMEELNWNLIFNMYSQYHHV